MLEFLKESTFRANDIIFRALNLLKSHYFSIASLCFLLFVISQITTFVHGYFEDVGIATKSLLMLLNIVLFFGLQLVLIKRAILLSQGVEHTRFLNYIPTTKQFINFLFGLVLCSLFGVFFILVLGVLFWPLIYIGVDKDFITFDLVPFLSPIISALFLMRITFFPFFILERNVNFFKAVKLSMAFTRGNFLKIVAVFLFLGLASLLSFVLIYFGYWYIAMFFTAISVFLIIPLVSLAMSVAYTDMLREYKGSENPGFFKSIL